MPYQYPNSIPDYIKNLPVGAQKLFIRVFNETLKETDDEDKARMAGWGAVKNKYKKVRDKWVPKVSTAEAKETLRKFTRGDIAIPTDDSIDLGEKLYPETESSEPWYPSISIPVKDHLLGSLPVGAELNVEIEAEIDSVSLEKDQKIIRLKLKKLVLKNLGQE